MYYIYALQDKNKKKYTGYSKNLRRRIYKHQVSKIKTTQKMQQPKLIYYETCDIKQQA